MEVIRSIAAVLRWIAAAALIAGGAHAQEPYRFGIANDLSGPSAFHGKTFAAGFNTAVRAVNEAGGIHGRKVELLQENAERNVQKEIGFLRKFAQQDKVLAAMIVTSDGLFAAKPIVESLKLPVTAIGVPELASNPPHPWIFNIYASYQDTVFGAVDYVEKTMKDGDGKWGVIYPDSQYGLEAVRALESRLQKLGRGAPVKAVMAFKETDATTQALALKQAGVKYVITQMTAFHNAAILRDAAKVGLDATFFATTQGMDREPDIFLSQPGGAEMVKRFVGVGPWSKWNEASIPGVKKMRDEVKKFDNVGDDKLGEIMYSNFVQGYVTAQVLMEGVRRAGPNATPEKLRDALAAMRNFDTGGITPPISFGPEQRKGFTSVKLYRIDPQQKVYAPIGDWIKVD